METNLVHVNMIASRCAYVLFLAPAPEYEIYSLLSHLSSARLLDWIGQFFLNDRFHVKFFAIMRALNL